MSVSLGVHYQLSWALLIFASCRILVFECSCYSVIMYFVFFQITQAIKYNNRIWFKEEIKSILHSIKDTQYKYLSWSKVSSFINNLQEVCNTIHHLLQYMGSAFKDFVLSQAMIDCCEFGNWEILI